MKRCPQCNRDKPLEQFLARNGTRHVRQCIECRDRYQGWESLSPTERLARMRSKPRTGIGYTAALVPRSNNRKTGPIPVSMTDMASCPTSCAMRDQGCYAEFGKVRFHWERVATSRGRSWAEFCREVEALPHGQLWRHNEAGDLPGLGDELDVRALDALVRANEKAAARGFTYTHKPLRTKRELDAVRDANARGFAINLSADSLEHADARAELGVGPVVVVVPENAPPRLETPAGRPVMVCLAQTRDLTCKNCEICAVADRAIIVGFRAHGQAKALVSNLVQLRRRKTPAIARTA